MNGLFMEELADGEREGVEYFLDGRMVARGDLAVDKTDITDFIGFLENNIQLPIVSLLFFTADTSLSLEEQLDCANKSLHKTSSPIK